jgi:hypothetical protein
VKSISRTGHEFTKRQLSISRSSPPSSSDFLSRLFDDPVDIRVGQIGSDNVGVQQAAGLGSAAPSASLLLSPLSARFRSDQRDQIL